MRAIRIHENGGAEKLRLEEVPVPEPKAGEVQVRRKTAGINFVDPNNLSAQWAVIPAHHASTPGMEIAGTVSAVGAGDLHAGCEERGRWNTAHCCRRS